MQLQQIELPQEWREALRRVQLYFPEAVIAGGALRDLFTGRQVKDIDVFVEAINPGDQGAWRVERLLAAKFGFGARQIINPSFANYSQAIDGVAFAIEVPMLGMPPLQVIALKEPVTFQSVV